MTNYFQDCKTLDEAKKIYWSLAKKFHPDKGGNEEDFKSLNNAFHDFKPKTEKFQNEAEQWNSKAYASILNELIKLDGLIIDVIGSFLWLSGNTKEHKDKIKSIDTQELYNCRWHRNKGMWYFSPVGYRKSSKRDLSLDQIKDFYGGSQYKSEEQEEKPGKPQAKINNKSKKLARV